jgi:nitrite reductase (NADH) small subunit
VDDVLASAQLKEGVPQVVVVGGHAVALVRVEGQVYAVDNACPHRGGELGRGDLQGHVLFCPLHAWCFDVRDGAAAFPQGQRLGIHEVEESGGRVRVRLGRPLA